MGFDETLAKLSDLSPNWDGYGAPKINAAALATARWLIAVPSADGGIQIEMHAGQADVEIYISPSGVVRGVSYDHQPDKK